MLQLTRAIDTCMEDGDDDHISVADGEADAPVADKQAPSAATGRAIMERYDTMLALQVVRGDEAFCWCTGEGCGSGQQHTGGRETPIMVCQNCGAKTCFVHQAPWHQGLTCEQYDAQRRMHSSGNTKKTREWQEKHAKRCPQCEAHIERIEGCDHMKVSRVCTSY